MMTVSILCFFLHFCVFIYDNLNVFKRFLYLYVFFYFCIFRRNTSFIFYVFLCISQKFCILALLISAYLHINIFFIYTFSNSMSLISTFSIILFFIFYVFNVFYRFFISTFYRSFMMMYLFFAFFSEFLNFCLGFEFLCFKGFL